MILIGSRNLGIDNEHSDYDYVELDAVSGGTFLEIQNERISKNEHCYHYNLEYRNKVAKFEIDDENDFQFIYNAEDYRAGVIDVNPFDYLDIWIEKLKSIDCYNNFFYSSTMDKYLKRFYHLVFNLECIHQNTLYPNMDRVKMFHDKKAGRIDMEMVISEIQNL